MRGEHVSDDPTVASAKRRIAAVKRRDRIATVLIRFGGVAVVVTVAGMLLNILAVAAPLFFKPSLETQATFSSSPNASVPIVATGVSNYGDVAYTVNAQGQITHFDSATGETLGSEAIREDAPQAVSQTTSQAASQATIVIATDSWGSGFSALLWSDGVVSVFQVKLASTFIDGIRGVRFDLESFPIEHVFQDVSNALLSVRRNDDGKTVVTVLGEEGIIEIFQKSETEDFLGEAQIETRTSMIAPPNDSTFTALTLSDSTNLLYAGTANGQLFQWNIANDGDPTLQEERSAANATPITVLRKIFGDVSLAVGDESGALTTWAPVRPDPEGAKQLQPIHRFEPHASPLRRVTPTTRNKAFFTLDDTNLLRYYHMTTERLLLEVQPSAPIAAFGVSANAAQCVAALEDGQVVVWSIEAPHPEISWATLMGKVWYENYDQPEYAWQSSASSDDYEAKFSLVPLIFGSFKATLYAMIFAVPLALLAAAYTSQFAKPSHRTTIKSTVEVMASVPSVVIGFIIALWLAPRVDEYLVSILSIILVLPIVFLVFIVLYQRLDNTPFSRRVERGYEFIIAFPVVLFACLIAWAIAGPIERLLFDDSLQLWLYEHLDETYDQRNAIIIAVGLGFAAIPIIFTIAEDAMSNLPKHLSAGSLALGASRWQTVWRIIMPSASPGIFAAVIIGFGRVIGETMIVLMATGNTAILDWSPFNGMRTLSANIAVEIPEAPQDGTLYRILFLSAVILFGLTFILNTAAEIIRQRLRNKYARFQ